MDAALAGLIGVALGIIGGIAATTVQFNLEKAERLKNYRRSRLEELWELLEQSSAAIANMTADTLSKMQTGDLKDYFFDGEEWIHAKFKIEKIALSTSLFVPRGSEYFFKLIRLRSEWVNVYRALAHIEHDKLTTSDYQAVIDKMVEMRDVCSTLQAEVLGQIHKLV